MAEIEEISLTGAQRTALMGLYGKALESRRPDSISPIGRPIKRYGTLTRLQHVAPAPP